MTSKKSLWDYIIYILVIIFIIIVFYSFFKMIKYKINYIPQNSINVSPLTGERIQDVYKENHLPVELTYVNKGNEENLCGLSNANIIYEYANNGEIIYKAIYYDKIPPKTSSSTKTNDISISSLPKLNFIDIVDLKKESENAEYIFVDLLKNMCSNFVYKDGLYYHFKNSKEDLDLYNNKQLSTSNIIVQFVDENITNVSKDIEGSGKGLLFYGGKTMKIKWDKHSKPIRITDEKGEDVSLIRGNTWWILAPKNSSVVYK